MMVSGCSKDALEEETSSSSSSCRCWSSACFSLSNVLSDDDEDEQENCRSKEKSMRPCEDDQEEDARLKYNNPGLLPSSDYCLRMNKENPEDASELKSDAKSSSSIQTASTLKLSNRSRSRRGFFPEGIGFRLGRAASLGSSNTFSRNLSIPYLERMHHRTDGDSISSEGHRTICHQESVTNGSSTPDIDLRNLVSSFQRRHRQRRRVESSEGTARFSRTLSVGRLRDRVLRLEGRHGTSLLSEEGSLGYIHQGSARRYLAAVANISLDDGDLVLPTSDNPHCSITRNAGGSSYNPEPVALPLRESNTQVMLEHRSAFLVRRRRIRSQVRALQRLSSRFENTTGHERSCILSGQHRTGRCTCRTNSRSANLGDDTSTRASISRIVMLAEALFEVLDEIHQQAVVLASQPSMSSIGSVPAPKEVIDCMPLRAYKKPQKQSNNDTAQCYICLVEYEEGDSVRILPCHHEFHRDCVDKWLKEIHRVCPLCRGDVCIYAPPSVSDLGQRSSMA